jgi:hypothetical protein
VAEEKLTTSAGERLEAYGEARIFELYLKHRGVRRLLKNLPAAVGTTSNRLFYEWLRADPTEGRWNRWQDIKAIIASDLVEEGLAIVDDADDGTVPAARLRSEYRRWIAEHYDRAAFGKTDINTVVNISVDQEFLVALKSVEEKAKAKREKIADADYEVLEEST